MYTLACADFGVDDGFVAKGETQEACMNAAMEHIKSAHPDKVAAMTAMPKEDVMAKMKQE